MNKKTDNELLDDVLSEAAPPDFREALLGQTLRAVRRRRHFRRARNAAVFIVLFALAGIFIWQKNPGRRSIVTGPMVQTPARSYTLVSTRPLPAGNIVTTRSPASVQLVTSKPAIEIVETTTGNFHIINDEQLLALVAAHPAVLVRTGPHTEQLVFANPADAKGFPLN
jgi:hypothetical protein